MKKRLFIALFAVILGVVTAGCEKKPKTIVDWLTYNYYVWVNESNHSITLSVDGWFNTARDGFKDLLLKPGEKHEEMIGSDLYVWYDWTVAVLFDDGLYGTEFSWHYDVYGNGRPLPEDYDVRYNPVVEENYDSEEVKNPNGCRQCAGVRWTYTFTDDDYEAAVAYGAKE